MGMLIDEGKVKLLGGVLAGLVGAGQFTVAERDAVLSAVCPERVLVRERVSRAEAIKMSGKKSRQFDNLARCGIFGPKIKVGQATFYYRDRVVEFCEGVVVSEVKDG